MIRKNWTSFWLILCCWNPLFAQINKHDTLSEVIVTGFRDSHPFQTSFDIAPYKLNALETHTPRNLSDALAAIPGISQMTTGGAISKPVI